MTALLRKFDKLQQEKNSAKYGEKTERKEKDVADVNRPDTTHIIRGKKKVYRK